MSKRERVKELLNHVQPNEVTVLLNLDGCHAEQFTLQDVLDGVVDNHLETVHAAKCSVPDAFFNVVDAFHQEALEHAEVARNTKWHEFHSAVLAERLARGLEPDSPSKES